MKIIKKLNFILELLTNYEPQVSGRNNSLPFHVFVDLNPQSGASVSVSRSR